MGEENLAADVLDKYYLVPAFVHPRDDKKVFDRMFPTNVNTRRQKAMCLLSQNLQSFAKWYKPQTIFGLPFRKAQGSVFNVAFWQIFTNQDMAKNDIDETVGVAINPFDDQQILVDWSEIDEDE